MGITISNRQRLLKIDRKRLHRNARFWLNFLNSNENLISLVFVRDNSMRTLNFQFRGIDETTDVLAFPDFFRGNKSIDNKTIAHAINESFIGDVIISTDEVKRLFIEEKKNVHDLIDELFLHGILHLYEYGHQTKKEKIKMRKIEKKLYKTRPK
ncbi:MAG: rRNA maturation RNase YbeY [Nitrospinota bacterium]|nr:rRNA maturation RNase YbeY [Nitrospinota bacterium]